ncbi:MAG: Kynureninase [Promethearchaeota archaeon]|nr:MAG: Kynureninase [Candidatus Lokiarchaeota archaeon]
MAINWEQVRNEQYPSIKEKHLTYFLSAGASLMNKNAYEEGLKYFNQMFTNGDIDHEILFTELEQVRKLVAEYINSKPYEVAFLINTSSGITVSAYMFREVIGEVIYPSIEFPASVHSFQRLGYPCKKIKPINGKYPVESFSRYLSDKTKYLVHSHVQSFNGFNQDLYQLGNFCKENDLISIINSTQAFGAFELDVKRFNIDILVSNALKWLGCGFGIGIIYINEDLVKSYQLPFTGWLSVDDPFTMDNENLNLIQNTRSLDSLGGCPNFASLLTLKGGLSLIKDTLGKGNMHAGIIQIQDRIMDLTSQFLEHIQEFSFKIITPTDIECRSGIITLEHPKAKKIHRYLTKNNVYTTLKKYPKDSRNTLIRFAINYYNNSEDIERAISILNSCKYLD